MRRNPDFLIYASDLAKYVIAYVLRHATGRDRDITNLKLQKILYYIEGYFMAKYGYSLYPALIEGWQFGPVLPSVYYEYSVFGADPIILTEKEREDGFNAFDTSITDPEQRKLINNVIEVKMKLDVWKLVDDTHSEDPWKKATSGGKEFKDRIITKRSIMQYFKTLPQCA